MKTSSSTNNSQSQTFETQALLTLLLNFWISCKSLREYKILVIFLWITKSLNFMNEQIKHVARHKFLEWWFKNESLNLFAVQNSSKAKLQVFLHSRLEFPPNLPQFSHKILLLHIQWRIGQRYEDWNQVKFNTWSIKRNNLQYLNVLLCAKYCVKDKGWESQRAFGILNSTFIFDSVLNLFLPESLN